MLQPGVVSGEDTAAAPVVEVDRVTVEFTTERGTVSALKDVSLSLEPASFLTILGPSGCGKSTLLRVIADLVAPSAGRLSVLGGTAQEARQRKELGFVFQDAALLPWRTAGQNVALPLEVGGRRAPSDGASPQELLALVGLQGWESAYPHELSGGMRQRVAIARALVTRPRLLLMDEPFGALDEITRDRLNEELLRIWETTRTTILFVTHSIPEALFLGQKVLVLAPHPGRVRELVSTHLPQPRKLAVRETAEFTRQAGYLRSLLSDGG